MTVKDQRKSYRIRMIRPLGTAFSGIPRRITWTVITAPLRRVRCVLTRRHQRRSLCRRSASCSSVGGTSPLIPCSRTHSACTPSNQVSCSTRGSSCSAAGGPSSSGRCSGRARSGGICRVPAGPSCRSRPDPLCGSSRSTWTCYRTPGCKAGTLALRGARLASSMLTC